MKPFGIVLYGVLLPLAVFFVSRWLDGRYEKQGDTRVLIAACVLFGVSQFIPSPFIHGHDTQFMTHLFGGGVFCGLLWLYHRSKFPIFANKSWQAELLTLFVLTCVLGTLNELYEVFAYEFLGSVNTVADTSYDLVANTLGVLLFYIIYKVLHTSRK